MPSLRPRLKLRIQRPQLRTQVLAGVLLVTLAALTVFDATAISELRRYLLDRTDANLQTVIRLAQPAEVAIPARGHATITRLGQRPAQARVKFSGPHLKLRPAFLDQYYLAYIPAQKAPRVFIEGNPDLVPKRLHVLHAASSWTVARTAVSVRGGVQLRLWTLPVRGGVLVASTSIGDVNKTVGRLRLILIIGSVGAALLVAFGVVLVLRRGLRPIEVMATEADRITAGDLADRVSRQDPRTEVGRLGSALNGMLTRIETSVAEREASQEATRRFFADASHELRTPLASLRANAELYQQGALSTRPQVDEAMRRITLEAQRMGKLVDDMLQAGQARPARRSRARGRRPQRAGQRLRRVGQGTSASQTWRTEIAPGWPRPATRNCCAVQSTTCWPTSAPTPRQGLSPRSARRAATARS